MWSCDPRRYTDYTDHDYCVAKGMEVYGHEYAMHFPYHRWPAGADKKLSSLHERLKSAGAQFGAYNGWERANWFAKDGDDTSHESTQTWSRKGPWQKRIQEECEAVRDHCGILPITGFSRYVVSGEGARAWLDGLTCSRIPKAGRIGLLYFADDRGRVVTEMSCAAFGDDVFGLITAGVAQWHDLEWLKHHAPANIQIDDITKEVECILVTGPKSREILAPLTGEDALNGPWLSLSANVEIFGQSCNLARVSFAGELGWEVHVEPEHAPKIWDALIKAGAKPFGMYALNSLRIEKGYRAWKGDLSTDYTVLESGLDRFVDFGKPAFKGREAIEAQRQSKPKKRFTIMTVDCEDYDTPYMANIWHKGEIVGECTSGAWGYRVGANIALGMIRSDLAEGAEVEIEIYGEKYTAKVHGDAPLWDPKNERIRA